jgi:hypothetical protein
MGGFLVAHRPIYAIYAILQLLYAAPLSASTPDKPRALRGTPTSEKDLWYPTIPLGRGPNGPGAQGRR